MLPHSTPVDDNTAPQGRSHAGGLRTRISWLGLAGLALIVALLGVGVMQARQFMQLRSTLTLGDEQLSLALLDGESAFLRLRDSLRLVLAEPSAAQAAAVRQAYVAWGLGMRRLGMETAESAQGPAAALQPLLAQAQVLDRRASRLLSGPGPGELDPEALRDLLPLLEVMDEPLQQLAQSASRRLLLQGEQRARIVRTQTRLGLVLTGFLTLMTLAFAAIALHQVHSLRERRAALEDLAARLRLARRDAEAASQAKSAFLANMSHEIRTPFHGLMGMLSLLREAGLTARQVDYLRTATESADHLLAVLNDILDISQLETGRLALSPAPVTLRTLLRDVESLMRPQASAKALALHIDAEPTVPERVLLDATRVRQIVFNLLSNAIKFSDHGAVVLDVRCRPAATGPGMRLEFVVSDTGVGMDEATQSRLFSRFMQGDSSLQRRHGGSGLGLEISRNLARLMDGDITARSKPGEGSVFTFWLPLRAVVDAPADEAAQAGAQAAAARPLHVLVAEDHPVNRQYLAALLEKQGHDAHFSANGEEAVMAAREQRFDLVLMDLHMPVLDGIAATRAIRASSDRSRATVPIVALTADAFPETQERCMDAGMNDFLTKPVSPQGLASCLRRLFGTLATPILAPAAPASPVAGGPVAAPEAEPPSSQLIDPAAMALVLQAMPQAQLKAMVSAYLDQGPETVQRLRAAIREAQPLDLRVHAHAAKGAALNLGLTGLAATAQALQGGAAHLPAHEIARLVQSFETQLSATRLALDDALARASALAVQAAQAPRR